MKSAKKSTSKKSAPKKKIKKKATSPSQNKSSTIPLWLMPKLGYLLLGLLTIVFFHEQLFGIKDFWSNYWADWTEITVPFFKLNIQAVQSGETPFWNPYAYGGTTHLAEPTSIFYYPVFFLLHYIVSPEADLERIVTWVIILHFFLLSVNMYSLGRYLKMSFWASILASVAFTYSCGMICKWQYVIVICGMAWFPLVIKYYLKLYKSDRIIWSDVIWAGIFVTLTFAGHVQYYFYNYLFLGMVLGLAILIKAIRSKKLSVPSVAKEISKYSIPLIISTLLLMIQILPTIELLPWTSRETITYEFASDGSFQWKQLFSWLSPHVFGYYKGGDAIDFQTYFATPGKVYHYWETAYFFGVIPLLFGIWGFYKSYRKPLILACLFTSIFFFFHALGSNSFLFQFLFELPGFDIFRIPSRTLWFVTFLLCLFSGRSLDQFVAQDYTQKDIRVWLGIGVVLLLGSLFILFGFAEFYNVETGFHGQLKAYGLRALLMTCAGLGALWIFKKFPSNTQLVAAGIVLLVFIDLAIPNKSYKNGDGIAKEAMSMQQSTKDALIPTTNEVFRYKPQRNRDRIFKRNLASYNNFYSMDGFYSFRLKTRRGLPEGWPINDLMSVRILSDVRQGANGGREAYFKNGTNPMPHYRMTYQVQADPSKNADPANINFLNTTVLENIDGINLSGQSPNEVNHSIAQEDYGFSKLKYRISTDQAGLFTLAEYWFPNWKAYLNGESVEVLKANHFTRGVLIPEGTHELEFKYESSYYTIGKWISLLTLFILVGFFAFQYQKMARSKKSLT